MNPHPDPTAAFATMLVDDVASLDGTQAAEALGRVKVVRGFLDHYEARLSSHIHRLHADGAAAPAADLHTRNGGVSAKEARAKERRARALDQAPSLAGQLAAGSVTAAHADAIADATCRLDDATKQEFFEHEAALASDATRMTPEQFAQNCRDLIAGIERDQGIERDRRQRRETRLSKKIDREGMYVLNARMHPELGHAVFNMIDAETAALVHAAGDRSADRSEVAARALGNLVTAGHQATRPLEAEIRLHVDSRTLLDGAHPDTVCEYDDSTPLPPPTVRRMACNGRIVPIVIDSKGVVLNAGRQQRLANRQQRRALRAMYRTCAFPGCDVPFQRCEIHHIEPFELGGNTDLADLLPVCARHHQVIHDPGWKLDLDAERTLTIRQPDGSVYATQPLRRSGSWATHEAEPDPPPDAADGRAAGPPLQLRLSA